MHIKFESVDDKPIFCSRALSDQEDSELEMVAEATKSSLTRTRSASRGSLKVIWSLILLPYLSTEIEIIVQEPSRKRPRFDYDTSSGKDSFEKVDDSKVKGKNESEHKKLLKSLRNPKAKVKAEMTLSDETLANRLIGIESPPFTSGLPREMQDFAVPREFISSIYGGSPQETFPRIAKRFIDQHGINDFMFPSLDYNPAAPQVPGAPGLFFKSTPIDEQKIKMATHRVITRLDTNQWMYMGQYTLTKTTPLTIIEWADQTPTFHSTWCREICETSWGDLVQKRIAARKRFKCREPNDNQILSIEKAGEWRKVGVDDVQRAFARGEEKLMVYRMVCQDYDTNFQKNLFEQFKTWTPKKSKDSRKSGKVGSRSKRTTKKVKTSQ